jgi:hypothetical protein
MGGNGAAAALSLIMVMRRRRSGRWWYGVLGLGVSVYQVNVDGAGASQVLVTRLSAV